MLEPPLDPSATAAADQMAAAVARGQARMIELAHVYLTQSRDRATTLARLFRHLKTGQNRADTLYAMYADALLRLAEHEGRQAIAGDRPPAPPA